MNHFDEPEGGYNKVLQLKNGNTFYFQFTKEDFQVFVYDKAHKEIALKKIKGNGWEPRKVNGITINGIYEINGEPTIFLTQIVGRVPTLIRLRFNPATGEIAEEKAINILPKYAGGSAWAMAYGDVDPSCFYVEKDPNSDAYSVVCFDGFAKESGKRLKLVQYNGQHQEVNSAYYGSPGDFKFTQYIAMCVNANETVMATYGYNQAGGRDARVIIAKLKNTEKEFAFSFADFSTDGQEHVVITRRTTEDKITSRYSPDISNDFRETKGMMVYNPGTDLIQLLTVTFKNAEGRLFSNKSTAHHLMLLSYIDPASLKITSCRQVEGQKVIDYAKSKFTKKDDFIGLPQNMIINSDKSTTLLFEEMVYRIKMRTDTRTYRQYKASEETFLENAGILNLNEKGEELFGVAIKKNQLSEGLVSALEQSEKTRAQWKREHINLMQARTNHFFSYDYVTTAKDKYVLFNDYPENFIKDDKAEKKAVKAATDANMVCYKIGTDGNYQKFYLFGKPENDKETIFSHIQSSDFLEETNSYATLVVERNGRKKQSRIAWLDFAN